MKENKGWARIQKLGPRWCGHLTSTFLFGRVNHAFLRSPLQCRRRRMPSGRSSISLCLMNRLCQEIGFRKSLFFTNLRLRVSHNSVCEYRISARIAR